MALDAIYKRMVRLGCMLLPPQTPSGVTLCSKEAATIRERSLILETHTGWNTPIYRESAFRKEREKLLSLYARAQDSLTALEKLYAASAAKDCHACTILAIAGTVDGLFGGLGDRRLMYGLTATIASVLLKQKVTAEDVRTSLRSGPWRMTHRMQSFAAMPSDVPFATLVETDSGK
jgi:hypothetical protein